MEEVVRREPVQGGYTNARRERLLLTDGTWVFEKRAVDSDTARWLVTEDRVYRALEGSPFMPRRIAFDDSSFPKLVLEDLGHAHWPPPWRTGDIERVMNGLEAIHATEPPAFLQRADLSWMNGWHQIAADPTPFLGLGWCSPAWLRQALPTLLSAEAEVPSVRWGLCHFDMRSDNLCFDGDRTLFIDWNHACIGPIGLDLAFWSVSLHHEGGPRPDDVVPPHPCWPARVSGFFASRAGQPELAHAPRVRWIQKVQLAIALPWACRAFALPEPDGPGWADRDAALTPPSPPPKR